MDLSHDETVVTVKGGDELGEVVIVDAGAKLTIEFLDRFGGQRVVVDRLDGRPDFIREEEVAFAEAQVILEAFVGAITCAAPVAELAGLCEVNFVVFGFVENAGLFIVKLMEGFLVGWRLGFKESFIGADDFRILVQTFHKPAAQPDDPFHPFGREKRIAVNHFGFLPDTIDPSGALNQAEQRLKFKVFFRGNISGFRDDCMESPCITTQVRHEGPLKHVVPNPTVAIGLMVCNEAVQARAFRVIMLFVPLVERRQIRFAIVKVQFAVSLVTNAGIEKCRILLADGYRELTLQCVDEDFVPQDVAMNGEQECVGRAFRSFEEVRAAESLQALSCPRQVIDDLGFSGGKLWCRTSFR